MKNKGYFIKDFLHLQCILMINTNCELPILGEKGNEISNIANILSSISISIKSEELELL